MRSSLKGMALGSALLATLAGCGMGPRLHRLSGGSSMQMSGSGSDCMAGGTQTIADYLVGKDPSGQKVGALIDCVSGALDLFVERVHGAQDGRYSPSELRGFFQTYFVRDFAITDTMMNESIGLKQAVVGGGADALTTDEIRRVQSIFATIKMHAALLGPYMPLTPSAVSARGEDSVDQVAKLLKSAAADLAGQFLKSGATYSITHLDALLGEFADSPVTQQQPQGQIGSLLADFRSRIPLIRALKSVAIDADPDALSSANFADIIKEAARVYTDWVRAEYLNVAYGDWSNGPGLDHLVHLVAAARNLLLDSVERHPGGVISLDELDRLVDALPPELLPATGQSAQKISPETIKKELRPLLVRIFPSVLEGQADVQGISAISISRMWRTFDQWAQGQRYLDALYARIDPSRSVYGGDPVQFLARDLLSYQPYQLFASRDDLSTDMLDQAQALQGILRDPAQRPVYFGNDDRMQFFLDARDTSHSLHDMSAHNWMRVVSRLAMNTYRITRSHAPNDDTDVTDYNGYRQLIRDFKPLGVDLSFLTEQDDEIQILQQFQMMNLFTFAGNGDNCLDDREVEGMLALMMSDGTLADEITADATKACTGPDTPKDPWGNPAFGHDCFRRLYFANLPKYWDHMPKLLLAYESLDSAGRAAFERNFEMAARSRVEGDFNTGDVKGFAMMPHYVESLFARFDLNQDGVIESDEAIRAFPVFRNLVLQAYQSLTHSESDPGDNTLLAVFTYMLAYGGPPTGGDLAQHAAIGAWMILDRPLWSQQIHADRVMAVNIFAALGEAGAQAHKDGGASKPPHVGACVVR